MSLTLYEQNKSERVGEHFLQLYKLYMPFVDLIKKPIIARAERKIALAGDNS